MMSGFERRVGTARAALTFMGCTSSEGWIGSARVISAVALTIRMHHATRVFESMRLSEVMPLEPGGDVEESFDDPFDYFVG
jgi:hypothetical protein